MQIVHVIDENYVLGKADRNIETECRRKDKLRRFCKHQGRRDINVHRNGWFGNDNRGWSDDHRGRRNDNRKRDTDADIDSGVNGSSNTEQDGDNRQLSVFHHSFSFS
jgi:hypothetical protein